jgi:hypothetical protein
MYRIKRFFLIFLLSKITILFSCPLCLSIPKNTDRPFFVDENIDHIEEFSNFLASKEPVSAADHIIESLDNK